MASLKVYLSNTNQALVFPVFKRLTTLGSSMENDIYIPDITIAKLHANIIIDGDDYFIHSVKRSPIYFNKKKIKKHKFVDNDMFMIGSTRFEFVINDKDVADEFEKTVIDNSLYNKLLELSDKISISNNFDVLLDNMLDIIVSLTNAEKGYILIFQDKEIVAAKARNINKENIGNPLKQVSDSIIQKVIKTQRPVLVSDALSDSVFSSSKSVINLKLSSVLCAPLKSGNELIGLIYLGNNRITNMFEHSSLEMLVIFSALTSLIVQNAFLLNKLKIEKPEEKNNMRFGEIVGTSAIMQTLFSKIEKVSPTDISVLITGETGTGKELVAKEIHDHSERASGNFVTVNCAAIPENLMESEFFGHKKGAFTGAVADQKGKFVMANGGTIFLDEIGEMPLNLQAKLLRVLQEKMITPIGASKSQYIDTRIIAATNKNLDYEVQKGTFREDLLYRLNVIELKLPALKDREDDIEILAKYFLNKFIKEYNKKVIGFTPNTLDAIKKHDWPGNIRELENRVKKAVVLADKTHITLEEIGFDPADAKVIPLSVAKHNFQKEYILKILKKNNWNKSKTATELGIDTRTIFRYLENSKT